MWERAQRDRGRKTQKKRNDPILTLFCTISNACVPRSVVVVIVVVWPSVCCMLYVVLCCCRRRCLPYYLGPVQPSFFFVLLFPFFFKIHTDSQKRVVNTRQPAHPHTHTHARSSPPRPSSLLPSQNHTISSKCCSIYLSQRTVFSYIFSYCQKGEGRREKGTVLPSTFQRTIPLLFIFLFVLILYLFFSFIRNGMTGMRTKWKHKWIGQRGLIPSVRRRRQKGTPGRTQGSKGRGHGEGEGGQGEARTGKGTKKTKKK